jgi:hypothetical protein
MRAVRAGRLGGGAHLQHLRQKNTLGQFRTTQIRNSSFARARGVCSLGIERMRNGCETGPGRYISKHYWVQMFLFIYTHFDTPRSTPTYIPRGQAARSHGQARTQARTTARAGRSRVPRGCRAVRVVRVKPPYPGADPVAPHCSSPTSIYTYTLMGVARADRDVSLLVGPAACAHTPAGPMPFVAMSWQVRVVGSTCFTQSLCNQGI